MEKDNVFIFGLLSLMECHKYIIITHTNEENEGRIWSMMTEDAYGVMLAVTRPFEADDQLL